MTKKLKSPGTASWAVIMLVFAAGLPSPVQSATRQVVVSAADAAPQTRAAAWDLRRLLSRVTGEDVPLIRPGDPRPDGAKAIEVGTERARTLAGDRLSKLGLNGSCAFSDGGDVALVGRDNFGTAGAVYDFLEKEVGCRWYTAWGDERIPSRPDLKLGAFEHLCTPPFESSWIATLGRNMSHRRNASWFLFRQGQNFAGESGRFCNLDLPPGMDEIPLDGRFVGDWSHSLFHFIPPFEKRRHRLSGIPKSGYFASHPEWFTYSQKEGKRVADRQLCFSNADLRNELTRNFLEFVRSTPDGKLYNISAMDVPGPFCECPGCQELAKRYGTTGGPLFDYLAEVGRELAKVRPEARLATLVYRRQQTQVPPNEAFPGFPSNILAIFAPIDDDFTKDMSHPHNSVSIGHVRRWSELVRHVWWWYYPIPYCNLFPYSGVRRFAADIRIMKTAGLTGTGPEHDSGRDCGANFFDLETYVMAKLMRDPSLDETELAREFCQAVYGAAGDLVFAYHQELERLRENCPDHVVWNKMVPSSREPANLVRWTHDFERMEARAKGDAELLQRIREVRLGVDYGLLSTSFKRLRGVEPDFAETPDSVYVRASNTIHRAFARRNDPGRKPEYSALPVFDALYQASRAVDLRPPEFADIPEDDYGQSFLVEGSGGGRRRPMADAAIGTAVWSDVEDNSDRKVCHVWIYDRHGHRSMHETDLVPAPGAEGRFHRYLVGRIRLTPDVLVVAGYSWQAKFRLDSLYVPGVDDEWDVYLDGKLEGPKFYPGSVRANRAAFDRVILIRVKAPPRHVVVSAADAAPQTKAAAWDLQRHLKRVTGEEVPLIRPGDPRPAGAKAIEVGTERARMLAGDRLSRLGLNGSCAFSDGGDVALVGRDSFGTSGAVYDFLEKEVGCRWYTAWGDERIPNRPDLKLGAFEHLCTPPFENSWIATLGRTMAHRRNGTWFLFRQGQNFIGGGGRLCNLDLPEGMDCIPMDDRFIGDWCHTLFNFVPPFKKNRHHLSGIPKEGYFAAHPDWFSYSKRDGKRVADRQLCFANAGLRREMTRNFLEFVRSTPDGKLYNISAMDVPGPFCECPDCLALAKRYGVNGGPFFDYLAEVGRELAKVRPEARLLTLAYRREQTQEPPNSAFPGFPSNILAFFAPIDDDFSKDMSHPNNLVSVEHVRRWSKQVNHIWWWYYPNPYVTLFPYSGVRRFAADIRILKEAGLTGTGPEHDSGRDCGVNFFDLETYVMAKLMRDLSLDETELARDFCRNVYGAAGDLVFAYHQDLERLREACTENVGWNKPVPSSREPANLVRWTHDFERMEACVKGDPDLVQKIREVRLGVDYGLLLTSFKRIRGVEPGFAETPDSIYMRATNTIARAFARRNDPGQKPEHSAMRAFDALYQASRAVDLRPPEFANVPDDDYGQSFLVEGTGGGRRRPMADASVGTAIWGDIEDASDRTSCEVWVYDRQGKRTMIQTHLVPAPGKEGKFHRYLVGRIRLTPEVLVVAGYSWEVRFRLDSLYVPGVDDEWDVYLDGKLEGPKFYPGSTRANRAAFDRAILIRAKK